MSGPTKGMVAGQPIQTGVVSDEYRDAHERIFGPEKAAQPGRYRFDPELGRCVPIDADWTDAERPAPHKTEGIIYSNLRATDGTVLDTRKKHRDYMAANNLSLASEHTESWAKSAKQREEVKSGRADSKARRELIGRALHESRNKPRGRK